MSTPSNRISLLGLSGSERAEGNTDQILRYAAEVAEQRGAQFSIISLRDYHIRPCGSCGECNYRQDPCETVDDMPVIIDTMLKADGIIYAVPVHGFGMGHLMQIFIERAGVGYLRFQRPLGNKVGGAIVTGRRYNHEHVHAQLVLNMLLNRMILVGSGFPAVVHGGKRNEAVGDSEGIDAVRRMVNRMIDMAVLLKHYGHLTNGSALSLDDENERMILPMSAQRQS